MSILGHFQKLGNAIMFPIAVLPIAGILLRIGQPDLLNIPFIAAGGQAVFTNLALLFAMGVGAGFSKDNSAAAAIASAVGYFILMAALKTLNPDVDPGVAGGIIIGVCAGLLYNRFHAIKLPEFLGFFGGKRFVPIVTGLVALVLAYAFSIIWPPIQDGINHLGQWILTSGVPGEFVYGVANRLLIPLGLHHILNSMVWFVFGSYTAADGHVVTGEISRFFAGDPTAGRILSGFFPVVMFGLPSAALAFYVTAKKENKKVVGGMLLSVALTAFLTGITEPIEFMFMFLAPALYLVHAILMGVSIVVASYLNIHMAFSFSSGLIDYILNYNAPAAHNSWEIIPMGLVVGAIYFVIFVTVIKMFNLKTPGREDTPAENSNPEDDAASKADLAKAYLAALGGKDNLTDISACITRLRLGIVDRSVIDDTKLKQLGAKGVVNVGSNNLQVILGPQAEIIANQMKSL
ncbi:MULTISPECIES: N-acetylglucosamine-specific PTS transporter subunit IIBC [unclassified Photobacterium]|uniref:N-acetylglucosamine-specific PTS transporter subunit IIBC n=1 Tax=unclassified Photobacterium TaxID=2628852 RepID=UPI000D17C35C|nr:MULTISPECIES: N-acetylglucosamine-specific PTS transporter subunit IIBC [unclassified Photobacterium]PSV27432.1 PTS sugar transporter [Photobacterium sp. GB-56]PSV31211.1 PTS sugar transporter [Photobacterium sp. GB-72]PSV34720.1 PTS sugar transporter [Photobacterium sp. GB-210]PSV37105.1 PTS sugar transporter [Photobacterium sp. GB-27]PSV44698.1 PTS sugar transporter [Photobacterium sp. GB-36]